MRIVFRLTIFAGTLATPLAALAFSPPQTLPNPTVTSTQAFWDLLCTGVIFFFGIVIVIGFVMLVLAGLNFMTAQGDENKIETARRMLLYGIIGVAVAILARAMLLIVANLFGITSLNGIFGC